MSSRLLDIHNFVGDKLQWQLQVIIDAKLSANARLVACLITHDLNVERGAAWRAQDNMALALGVHRTTVRRGIAELAKAGYLAIRKAKGRSRSLNYHALIRDAAEAHDNIDRAIQARRDAASQILKDDASALVVDAGNVAPALVDPSEEVAPALLADVEDVAPVLDELITGATLTLEESITPPLPPARPCRAGDREARTNRVRDRRPVAATAPSIFQDPEVREFAKKKLGDEGVRSWIDPNAWDPTARAIVCPLNFTAERIKRDIGRDLRDIGVKVVCDKRLFDHLMRTVQITGRDDVSERTAA